MLDLIKFTSFYNLSGGSPREIEFNTDQYPINTLEFEYDVRTTKTNRMQGHGAHPGRLYVGATLGHQEGQILAADSTEFTTLKFNILDTILPAPLDDPTFTPLGKLTIQLTGMSETASALTGIDGDISIPMQGLSPSRAPCNLTWLIYDAFTGDTSGDPYWIK